MRSLAQSESRQCPGLCWCSRGKFYCCELHPCGRCMTNDPPCLVLNGGLDIQSPCFLSGRVKACGAGGEAVVMEPGYRQIRGIAENLGLKVRDFPLEPQRGWRPDLKALRDVVSHKTRLIASNLFLSNPFLQQQSDSMSELWYIFRFWNRCRGSLAERILRQTYHQIHVAMQSLIPTTLLESFWPMRKSTPLWAQPSSLEFTSSSMR